MRGRDALADDLAGGEDVTSGLHRRDSHDDEHGDDAGDGEGGDAEVEGRGDADHGRLAHAGEVSVTQDPGQARGHHEANENRDRGHEALEDALDEHDEGDGEHGVAQASQGGAGRVRPRGAGLGTPGDDVPGGHAHQRGAHDRQERAGDYRREETQQAGKPPRNEEGGETGSDDRAVHRRQPLRATGTA